jgi:hypothetical protein
MSEQTKLFDGNLTEPIHIVVDLETLSLRPSAIILSIGAASNTGGNFYVELDYRQQERLGRHADLSTCLWWGEQERDLCPLRGVIPLATALVDFAHWIALQETAETYIWARGTDFDIAVLNDAFRKEKVPVPWVYKNVRDIRTALAITRMPEEKLAKPERKHHAFYDAEADLQNLVNAGIVRMHEEGGV